MSTVLHIRLHRRLFLFFLLALAPGFVFLVQVVVFIPPAAILATVLQQIWQTLTGGQYNEMGVVLFFFPHFLLFTLLYWLLAGLFASLIKRLGNPTLIWLMFVGALAWTTQQTFYGAGGHGPGDFGPVQMYFLDPSWAFGTHVFYLVSLIVIGSVLGLRQRYKK